MENKADMGIGTIDISRNQGGRCMKRTILLFLLLICHNIFASENEFTFLWGNKATSSMRVVGLGITMDLNRNTYITGYFENVASFGELQLSAMYLQDAFIAKLNPDGVFIWANSIRGQSPVHGTGIATDKNNNIYVIGRFWGVAYFGDLQLVSEGTHDIFIAKLNPSGNFIWAKKAGGVGWNTGRSIQVGADGDLYITGDFSGIATFGNISLETSSASDIFVAKLNSEGEFIWAKSAGGSGGDHGYDLCTDIYGNSYVIGKFSSTAIFGEFYLTSHGDTDIFITQLCPDGNFTWATGAGGTGYDNGYGITIDSAGNSYITGEFQQICYFGDIEVISNGNINAFIAKIDPYGNFLWAQNYGGQYSARGTDITIDYSDNIYFTGFFMGIAEFGDLQLVALGDEDVFVAKLDNNGNILWAKRAGGYLLDFCTSIVIDYAGNLYITGYFEGTAGFGDIELTGQSFWDCFIVKMGPDDTSESIELLSFNATGIGNMVNIMWVTLSETDNLGYNLYRLNAEKISPFISYIPVRLNDQLIEGQGTTSNVTLYYYQDQLYVQSRYFYLLESISANAVINVYRILLRRVLY